MGSDFFEQKRPHNGLTPAQYMAHFRAEIEKGESDKLDYLKLNWQRSHRIEKTYTVSDELRVTIEAITEPQLWMVLTEPWCGDSAQNLGYIIKMAACNPKIDLRILLRDQNLDIMDQYLTNGKRGIPKLVAFAADGKELFRWGPRPAAAQAIFDEGKAAGQEKEEIMKAMHLWYGRNRGKALEQEFLALLKRDF